MPETSLTVEEIRELIEKGILIDLISDITIRKFSSEVVASTLIYEIGTFAEQRFKKEIMLRGLTHA